MGCTQSNTKDKKGGKGKDGKPANWKPGDKPPTTVPPVVKPGGPTNSQINNAGINSGLNSTNPPNQYLYDPLKPASNIQAAGTGSSIPNPNPPSELLHPVPVPSDIANPFPSHPPVKEVAPSAIGGSAYSPRNQQPGATSAQPHAINGGSQINNSSAIQGPTDRGLGSSHSPRNLIDSKPPVPYVNQPQPHTNSRPSLFTNIAGSSEPAPPGITFPSAQTSSHINGTHNQSAFAPDKIRSDFRWSAINQEDELHIPKYVLPEIRVKIQ